MKIKCYCDLYVSESLKNKQNQILEEVMEQRPRPSVYLITLAQGKQNHLEFYSGLLLWQHVFDHAELFVVGLADGYYEAVELVEKIINDTIRATRDVNVRGYLNRSQMKFEESRAGI